MMRKRYTYTILVFLLCAITGNSFACSCAPPSLTLFWDFINKHTHNALVRFEGVVEEAPEKNEMTSKFAIVENYNIPGLRANDHIFIKSGMTTCDADMRGARIGDSAVVALNPQAYWLYAGCTFNSLGIRGGISNEGQTLEELRARIMTITSSSKELMAMKAITLYPNPATSNLTVTVPYAGRLPYRIDILDMTGRVVKTKETDRAEESLAILDLKNGLYMLKLSFNGGSPILQKWVKQ